MNITFVTSAPTDEEGYALLKEFGLPFKNSKKINILWQRINEGS